MRRKWPRRIAALHVGAVFEFGEGLLNRIKIGTMRGKIEQPHPGIFETFADARDFMRRQIIGDDDGAWLHLGDEVLDQPLAKDFPRHGLVD